MRPRPALPATRAVHTLPVLIQEHLAWLAATNYARATIKSRRSSLLAFARWAEVRGVSHPRQVTLSVLERYQQALAQLRRADGRPLSWGAQAQHLLALKLFLSWCTRTHVVRVNAARELQLPRRPQRLPRAVLSAAEAEQVLAQPDGADALGLRDRAILETLYSTGLRRLEVLTLMLADVDAERGVVLVREGKGQKDRVVPIGQRALDWIDTYLREARPLLVVPPDLGVLFLTRRGRRLRPNRLTELVHRYVQAAGLGKQGSCHLFRHTMATLLLEGGADIRHIQAMLGHAELSTTALYTRVSVARLKAVHARTHPAERPPGDHDASADALRPTRGQLSSFAADLLHADAEDERDG